MRAPPISQHLFIVARGNPGMRRYLEERFKGDDKVRVIVDRRFGERRTSDRPPLVERRRHDRRSRPEIDAQLRTRSYVVVTVPEPDFDG